MSSECYEILLEPWLIFSNYSTSNKAREKEMKITYFIVTFMINTKEYNRKRCPIFFFLLLSFGLEKDAHNIFFWRKSIKEARKAKRQWKNIPKVVFGPYFAATPTSMRYDISLHGGNHILHYKEWHLKTIKPTTIIYSKMFLEISLRGYLYACTESSMLILYWDYILL